MILTTLKAMIKRFKKRNTLENNSRSGRPQTPLAVVNEVEHDVYT